MATNDAINAYGGLLALRKMLESDGPIPDTIKIVMNEMAENLTRLVGRSYPKGWHRWVPFTFPTYAQQRRGDVRQRRSRRPTSRRSR
jgi:hypothetical protein